MPRNSAEGDQDLMLQRFNVDLSGCCAARSLRAGAMPVCVLAALTLLSGCYKPQEISVTIKAAEGAAVAEAGGAAAESSGPVAGYGNLTGTVRFDGGPAPLPNLVNMGDSSVKDASVCAAATIPDESLVVNANNNGIANVVIYLDKKPANIKPELAEPPKEPAIFDQKGCRFLPHVLTVRVGGELLIRSDDSIAHNTHTFPSRNTGFNSLIQAGDRVGVPCNYSKPENMPVEVKCDLHPWMRAYHFPLDHPYVAVTDADGKFQIPGLPAGKHVFKVWQEKGSLLERKLEITIKPDEETVRDLTYGSAKFAGQLLSTDRSISFARLQRGGGVHSSPVKGNL